MNPQPKHSGLAPLAGVLASRMCELNITSIDQLARATGLPRTMLYFVRNGRVSKNGTTVLPSVDTLTALARAFNRPAHDLLYLLIPDARDSPDKIAASFTAVAGVIGCFNARQQPSSRSHMSRPRGDGEFVAYEMLGNAMDGGRQPIGVGALIVVNRAQTPKPGDLVVARLANKELLCRLMRRCATGYELVCSNPAHTEPLPSCVQSNELESIIGVVHQIQQLT